MNIGVRQLQHPTWVENVFEAMPEELRDRIVKTAISALVKPEKDGFHLHSYLVQNSNRVPFQQEVDGVITAMAITEAWIAYSSVEDKNNLKFMDEVSNNKNAHDAQGSRT